MKIVVTGGAGFIGSHLVDQLILDGHHVVSIDDLSNGKPIFHDRVKNHPNFRFVSGSVTKKEFIKEFIKDCDVIFHLAAVLGVKNTVENPLKVIEGNIEGTKSVLELAHLYNKKVVFTSTSEVYGKNDQIPFHENSLRVLGATTTHRWCYATAKALDEHLCFAYAQIGLPVTVVRYFNVYGPRATATQYGGVVPRFILAALRNEPITVYGTGEQTRCFTFKDDAVKGTILCMGQEHNNEVFNIGTDHQITINMLAEQIKRLTASKSSIVHIPYEKAYGQGYEDSQKRTPDLTKSRTKLGYHPATSIEEGLKQTIEWYKNHYNL